jgi:hypothetical protein
MNKTYKSLPVCCLLFIALSGCSESLMNYDINTETPVVESYLQEGAGSLTVKVYNMEVYLKNGEVKLSKPVGGLQVYVNNHELTETSSGFYRLELENDTLHEGQIHNLQFEYNSKSIEASTAIPAPIHNLRVEPESIEQPLYFWNDSDTTEITVFWDDPENSYYQVYIESPDISDMPSFGIYGRRMMQPFKGSSWRTTARDFRSAGTHWIYVYRVNKDYVELYERTSSSDLANPVSFIQNAFGIFTAMSVARVRLQVYESSE